MKPKARCDNVCMVFESAILEETLYSENLRNPLEANNFLSNVPFLSTASWQQTNRNIHCWQKQMTGYSQHCFVSQHMLANSANVNYRFINRHKAHHQTSLVCIHINVAVIDSTYFVVVLNNEIYTEQIIKFIFKIQ